jgi:hypothetical protein
MSKKTIKQRIALVAALALGTGVLSVAPASASAASFTLDGDTYVYSASATATNFGVCFVGSSAAVGDPQRSVKNTDALNADNTAEVTTAGQLTITTGESVSAVGDSVKFTVTGPATISASGVGTATLTYGADLKSLTATGASSALVLPTAVNIKPTGAGTIQVTITETDGDATTGDTSQVLEIITITSRTSCVAGTPSAADSGIKWVATGAKATQVAYADITNNDVSGANSVANGGSLFLRYDIYDANGTAAADSVLTGTLTAEVSSGAIVAFEGATPSINTAYATDKEGYWTVKQATEDTPWAGTITIKLNGTTVATKSGVIQGPAKTIEVSSIKNVAIAADGPAGRYLVKDAAGNELETAITGFDTFGDANAKVGAAGSSASSDTPSPGTADVRGTFDINCSGSKGGTLTGIKLKYTNSALVSIYSAPFNVVCGSATVATYTASLDKASYVPGDIATLTITAKDAYGNAVADTAVMGTSSAGEGVSISGSNMTAVTAPTNADTFTGGAKTYKFVVGSTEGSYNLVVDLDKWTTSTYSQSAVVVPYAIKASTTTVSNADVLKSIVSLIASINKQIQALQKLILRR